MKNPIKKLTVNNRKEIPDNHHRLLLKLYENTNLSDNEKEYLVVLMEMTKDDIYRWHRFKQRYEVSNTDRNGDRELTLNKQRVKVHPATDEKVIASKLNGDLIINVDKLCKIPTDKEIDAVMQHEDGHRKLHTIDPKSKAMDKKRTDLSLRADVADELFQKFCTGNRKKDTELANEIDEYIDTEMPEKDLKMADEELIGKRKTFRINMRKYAKPGSYIDVNELEADQYAANKVGKNTLIEALNSMDELDKEYAKIDIDDAVKKETETKSYKKLRTDKERKKYIKKFKNIKQKEYDKLHKIHLDETEIRVNALNDNDAVDDSVRRSLSD